MAATFHEPGEGTIEPARGAAAMQAPHDPAVASPAASPDEEQDMSDSSAQDSSEEDQEETPRHHAWPVQLDHPLADVLIADGTDGVALGSPYTPAEQIWRRPDARRREGTNAGDGPELENESGEEEDEEDSEGKGEGEGEKEDKDEEKEEKEGQTA
ncbi:hypothetical protein RTBOTA2_004800 [Rhodotorula toruloides]|uniref:Uncharacterized protein n=1 Tax=Rhodotorula toruloides TaxID=5286 RepID=A0A2T0AD64_RHOTO|nr:hypothetical protein RTBOTA2_004800 [Rhodotorula toruloides]PRQ75924.1 hypothetical protein AAT19DRAFT_12946 [Rhodotorula toruloides]